MNLTDEQHKDIASKISKLMESLMGDVDKTMQDVHGKMHFMKTFLGEWRKQLNEASPGNQTTEILSVFLQLGEQVAIDGMKQVENLLRKK